MPNLTPPHGSDRLKPLLVPEAERAALIARAASLRQVPLSSREVSDLFMLGMGAYTPLDGFMGEADWRGACLDMKLRSGVFWPIPITASASSELAGSLTPGEEVALTDGDGGALLGLMTVEEAYTIDRELECAQVYRTTDAAHPGVQKVLEQDYRAKKVVYASKFTFSAPCADDTLDSLVAECDAIIHGIAD